MDAAETAIVVIVGNAKTSGFTAGMTLDAVFRKLIATDVLQTSSIEARKRS